MNNQNSKIHRFDESFDSYDSTSVTGNTPNPTSSPSKGLQALIVWLDGQLFALEEKYQDFVTNDSSKLKLSSR